jgi:cell division protein FtsL
MTDYAEGIETRNYGVKCVIDARVLTDLIRTIVCLAMVAGALLFCSWVRSQIISTGYESQKLFAEEQSLLRDQDNLKTEEAKLRDPERIDILARNLLGMSPLNPNQLILPPLKSVEISAEDNLALAVSESTGMKKATAKRPGNFTN